MRLGTKLRGRGEGYGYEKRFQWTIVSGDALFVPSFYAYLKIFSDILPHDPI